MGMRRARDRAKLDEIVEFAGVAQFLDTPVKRYSSGMYLRLAFSVAAHLEPEILLVDEVLAVGDADFQKKCLGRMEEIGESGRTVLFVSHCMPSVLRLCDRVILFDQGGVLADGRPRDVIRQYLDSGLGLVGGTRVGGTRRRPGRRRVPPARPFGSSRTAGSTRRSTSRSPSSSRWSTGCCATRTYAPSSTCTSSNEDGVLLFITADSANRSWRMTPRRRRRRARTVPDPGALPRRGPPVRPRRDQLAEPDGGARDGSRRGVVPGRRPHARRGCPRGLGERPARRRAAVAPVDDRRRQRRGVARRPDTTIMESP